MEPKVPLRRSHQPKMKTDFLLVYVAIQLSSPAFHLLLNKQSKQEVIRLPSPLALLTLQVTFFLNFITYSPTPAFFFSNLTVLPCSSNLFHKVQEPSPFHPFVNCGCCPLIYCHPLCKSPDSRYSRQTIFLAYCFITEKGFGDLWFSTSFCLNSNMHIRLYAQYPMNFFHSNIETPLSPMWSLSPIPMQLFKESRCCLIFH